MKYVSIDVESLGLKPYHSLIEFGAVLEDTENPMPISKMPTFHCYLLPPSSGDYIGSTYAIAMHAAILSRIAKFEDTGECDGYNYLRPMTFGAQFRAWLNKNGEDNPMINVAGKNFSSCDKIWLDEQTNLSKHVQFSHRYLDPAQAFAIPSDKRPPCLKTCKERAGISGEVAHTAVEDAMDVVKLLRYDGRLYGWQSGESQLYGWLS